MLGQYRISYTHQYFDEDTLTEEIKIGHYTGALEDIREWIAVNPKMKRVDKLSNVENIYIVRAQLFRNLTSNELRYLDWDA